MAKITEYPQATTFDANDVLLKDGTGGTKKIRIEDVAKSLGLDTLTKLTEDVKGLESVIFTQKDISSQWLAGGLVSSSGKVTDNPNRIHSSVLPYGIGYIKNLDPDHFGYYVFVYTSSGNYNGYLGYYGANGFVLANGTNPEWKTGDTLISSMYDEIVEADPNHAGTYYYRIVLAKQSNGTYNVPTSLSDGSNIEVSVISGSSDKMFGLQEYTDWSSDDHAYFSTASNTININSPMVASTVCRYQLIECSQGDVFIINTTGGNGSRAYAFIGPVADDGTAPVLINNRAAANARLENYMVAAPAGSTHLVVHDTSTGYTGAVFGIFNGAFADATAGDAVLLVTGVDADDIIDTGAYQVITSYNTAHWPFNAGGLLFVRNTNTPTVSIVQIAVNKNEMAHRLKDTSGWSNWIYDTAKSDQAVNDVLPVLALTGDASGMSKDNAKELSYAMFKGSSVEHTGTCEVKWQGSSSLNYAKKNYTVKLKSDNATPEGEEFAGLDMSNLWAQFINAYRTTVSGSHKKSLVVADYHWGEQKKFCTKANFIDPSHMRNIVCARLWGEIVASRGNRNGGVNEQTIALANDDKRRDAPNWGAIDGFPIQITLNGTSLGLYTMNIPKDKWTFAMSGGDGEFVVAGENNFAASCRWMASFNVSDWSEIEPYDANKTYQNGDIAFFDDVLKYYYVKAGTGSWQDAFTVEVFPKPSGSEEIVGMRSAMSSFNTVLAAISPNTTTAANWKTVAADLLDIDSVFDYYIYCCCIYANDAFARNTLYGTYDGQKWFLSAYDLDTTFGFNPYGTDIFSVEGKTNDERASLATASNMNKLADLVIHDSTFKARWAELRNGLLSDAHIFELFNNFGVFFTDNAYRKDRELWPMLPATPMHNVAQFVDFYKMHCAALDKEVEALN